MQLDWQLVVDFCEDVVMRAEFDKENGPYYASMCINVARLGYLKRCTSCSSLMILVERHFERGIGFYDSTTKFLISNLKPLVHGVRICGKETDFMYNDKNGMFEVIEVNQKHACRNCLQDSLVGEPVVDESKLKKLSKFGEIAQKSTINTSLFMKILRLLKTKDENKFWNVVMFRIDSFLRHGSIIDKFILDDEEMRRKRGKCKLTENLHFRLPGLFPGQVFVYNQKSNEYALCLGYLGHHKLGLMDRLVNRKIMSMRQMEHFQDKIARARDFNRATPIDTVVVLSTDCPR